MISKFGRKNTKAIYKTTKKGLWIVQLHNFSLHPKAGVILTRGQAKLSPEAGIPCLHSANLNLHDEYCQDILFNTGLNPRYTEKCLPHSYLIFNLF